MGDRFIKNSLSTMDNTKSSIDSKISDIKFSIKDNIDITKKDNIFLKDYKTKFDFNESVANVFDDMIERSVPFYKEVIDLTIFFILKNLKTDSLVVDLGCSTGNFLLELDNRLRKDSKYLDLVGIDSSESMIKRAKLKNQALGGNIKFICQDFLNTKFSPCDFFISHYTMQFVRPLERIPLIKNLYNSLRKGGILFMAEKTISTDSVFEPQMIDCYHNYKIKNGYTHSEIYKKREALENVLVPFSMIENLSVLKEAGFEQVELPFKWINFNLFMARK